MHWVQLGTLFVISAYGIAFAYNSHITRSILDSYFIESNVDNIISAFVIDFNFVPP